MDNMRRIRLLLLFTSIQILLVSFVSQWGYCDDESQVGEATSGGTAQPYVVVLGIAQDGGFPQAGCQKSCCKNAWQDIKLRRFVSCLAIVDPATHQRWLLDCTPDFRDQLRLLDTLGISPQSHRKPPLDGIFLTHAHIGHYGGLLQLGREVIGAESLPLYVMPRMQAFLQSNGPWEQLVALNQVSLRRIAEATPVRLNDRVTVIPFTVPHRDEYSETVGFRVESSGQSMIYLPDIDKWERWDVKVEDIIRQCDVAFLDGTFFNASELPGRDLSEIPHPTIEESLARFSKLNSTDRAKIHFIHLNHSNDALRSNSPAVETIERSGMHVAAQEMTWSFAPTPVE